MITDEQYRRLLKMSQIAPLYQAADKAGMSEKTARKYLKLEQLPSELERVRSWQTRANPFKKDWRLIEELVCLRSLPHKKLDQTKWVTKRVSQSSTIRIETNTYSVHSRLIGETLRVGVKANSIELWVAQKCVARFPRLRGKHKHRISYRHIIHSLHRKPGAFAQYQYKDDLYPSSWFRKAYDWLSEYTPSKASKYYLEILYLAATVSEEGVEKAIKWLLDESEPISPDSINALLSSRATLPDPKQVHIQAVHLQSYDQLIGALA